MHRLRTVVIIIIIFPLLLVFLTIVVISFFLLILIISITRRHSQVETPKRFDGGRISNYDDAVFATAQQVQCAVEQYTILTTTTAW